MTPEDDPIERLRSITEAALEVNAEKVCVEPADLNCVLTEIATLRTQLATCRESTIKACAEVAKRFIVGSGTPYVNGMNDSAVRIYQGITLLDAGKEE